MSVMPAFVAFLVLFSIGVIAGVVLGPRLAKASPDRLARRFLIAVTILMGVRITAYLAANVFAVQAVRPSGGGPYDLTNVLVGGLWGVLAAGIRRPALRALAEEPELLLAMRIATGVAFILAGLGNVFFMERTGIDFFVHVGYTHRFHLLIMTAEILGGAALLLPWRWLTLAVTAGLVVDMSGALYTHYRIGDSLNAATAAIVMLFRLGALALLASRGGWFALTVGAIACVAMALVGALMLLNPAAP